MYNRKKLNDGFKIKMGLFALLVVLVLATVVQAEPNDAMLPVVLEAEVSSIATNAGDAENTAVEPAVELPEELVNKKIQSITFKKDMRIRDALAFLSLKYDKNIVPSQRVDGTLAFTGLFDVSFEEAMKAILGDAFKYEQDGNLIKVYTAEEYKTLKEDKGRMISKVFTLYYISAAEAVKLVAPMLSGVGNIQGSSPAEKILPTGQSINSGSGGGDSMALNDMIVIRDYPEKIAEVEALIKQLDVRPLQVLVEATILSAKLNEDTEFGIDWNTLSGIGITHATVSGNGGAQTQGFTGDGLAGLTIGISKDSIAAIITALDTITDVTIMANPKILAINKQLGQVYIGTKLGYRDAGAVSSSGNLIEGEVKFLETGTKLSFRPYIGDNGYIRMDIQPKDSSGDLVGGVPQETSTELATNIMVKDGETVVIGGLFRNKVSTTRTQVPLLGDLPLIGLLFRGTNDSTERQEVIVLLTPHIVTEPAQTNGAAAKEDISRRRIGSKNGMQCYDHGRLAEDNYAKAARFYMDGDNDSAMKEVNAALHFRPTYQEAMQLKERIIMETIPAEYPKMERKVLQTVGQQ